MSATMRGMTDKAPRCPLVECRGLFVLDFLDLASLCESLTLLTLVGAGFANSYRHYEQNKFGPVAKVSILISST